MREHATGYRRSGRRDARLSLTSGICPARGGFSLIEVLVTSAIIALLLSIVAPAITAAREAGRAGVCRANLRQIFLACRMYADLHRGIGPALGSPYTRMPNWAVVVRSCASDSRSGETAFSAESVLVCPTVQIFYSHQMTRTYGVNVTGKAGLEPGETTYDDPLAFAHVRMDRIPRPSESPLVLDSARSAIVSDGPPPPRTASVIDFRQESHVETRTGWFHDRRTRLNAAMYDGSVGSHRTLPAAWRLPLP